MSQTLTYIENSVFLCQHQAIKLFAINYKNNYSLSSQQHWSIVCERKEDIVTIRNQIFIELELLNQKSPSILSGISIYTLDTLGQKICACLAHIDDEKIRQKIPYSLFKPYIDITNQEKLVETILHLFGYSGSDSLALAKQILTLIDVQLPPDTNIAELIVATQEGLNTKTLQTSADISLRQILATIQQAKIELAGYARFQILVNFFAEIMDNSQLKLPAEILSSSILWICAPEYFENNFTIKPGNFQGYIVDDFKNGIKKIRADLNSKTHFYDSRTILSPAVKLRDDMVKQDGNDASCELNVFVSSNNHSFFQLTQDLMNSTEYFVLLGDFDPHSFQTTLQDASGTYPITKKDIENWKNNCVQNNPYFAEVKYQINEMYEKFLDIISYVQSYDSLQKIAQIYSLNEIKLDENSSFELFMSRTLREKVTIGSPHPLALAPKVLSYFNGTARPLKIICVGRPHSPVSQSFNVKILNQVFFLLKQKGIELEIPATETMYKLFWKNLTTEAQQMEFWIADKNDLEQFPSYLKISNTVNLNSPFPSNFNFKLQSQNSVIPSKIIINTSDNMPITQFEDYVYCPHKYYLKHILNIKKNDVIQTPDFKEIGTKMHKICEQFITRFVTLFGNEGYLSEMPEILNKMTSLLQNETLFLSFEKTVWLEAIYSTFENPQVVLAIEESIHSIWENENESSFLLLQQQEILKRTFLKFLLTERENLKNNSKLKIGLFRELPVQFEFAGLKFKGRIDRIDLTAEGLEIIDYKTSNIAKLQKEITLSPSKAKENNKVKLSVQGALYTYGFAKSHSILTAEAGEDFLLNNIKYYSLYFLKNLDENKNNCLKYSFEPAFEKENSHYIELEDDYKIYVQNFLESQFLPNPIQGDSTCLFCEYKTVCPRTHSAQSSSNSAEEVV